MKESKEKNNTLEFEDILQKSLVIPYYQPIVNLKSGEILGYEALARGPRNTDFYSPLAMIEKARECGKIWELELLFRQKAFQKVSELKDNTYLFVNVDPEVIKSPEYEKGLTKELIEKHRVKMSNIVFEITERTAIFDYVSFMKVLKNYRDQGYKIAIDDVGAGHSGLVTINEVRPNFIKIDMTLIRNIDKDAYKQALIKAFVDTSTTTNIKVIAEGIETKEELKALIMLGVHGGQGFYLKKPSPELGEISEKCVNNILKYNHISRNLNDYSQEYHYISNLARTNEHLVFESMTPCMTIKSQMDKSKNYSSCICERQKPVGLVMRHKINASLSGQFGFSLYSNKPISKIMDRTPLIVDYYQPINKVAKCAMERPDDKLFDDIIVTKADVYYGIVPMKRIFEYALMYEKTNAKDKNPLTGLPGNPVINRTLQDVINYAVMSCVMYVDINEFKIYNDIYGFEKGDEMIMYLSKMLTEVVKTKYPYSGFIGHIGGDDFLIIIEDDASAYHEFAKEIIRRFEMDKICFFDNCHLKSRCIVSEDRFGIQRKLPLTSISIAGISGELSKFVQTDTLTALLAKLKSKVKKSGKSDYLVTCASEVDI